MQGWLVSQDGIPQTVLITQFGMILAATGFDYEQPDALIKTGVKDLPYKPGFHIRFSTLCLSVNSAIDVYVDIKTRAERLERLRLGSIDRIRFQPLNGIAKSRYAPILVPALGRSGTTLLMGLLNAHPEIIAPGKYPFEYRQASYFWHAIRILTSPANFSRSMHPDGFEQNNFYQLGYNPYVHGQFYKDFAFDRVAE